MPVVLTSLTVDTGTNEPVGGLDTVLSILEESCGLPALACEDLFGGEAVTITNVQPGAYEIVVDGFSTNFG